ncbi:MAG: tRNA uridine(34) 5-carboxymethylaminomethyl modification radical SAM/GNAT enzyme Elp3 [Thermoproteota archaeon]|nr:MAG: tRNA uridine(34) 5-carboxymethylaminomethyl modification radical SAM/GNAT enzyme Elp3 [Candidatus Korarchaeota archaeon]
MDNRRKACIEIAKAILSGKVKNKKELERVKVRVSRKYRLKGLPKNSEILEVISDKSERVLNLLKLKAVRTYSGIAVFSVMSVPWPCPKSKPCIYCPGGPEYSWGPTPQSYTGMEPAGMRAIQHAFDPYRQVKARLNQLESIGHSTSKVEIIIQGGTFPAMPAEYQKWFVKRCLDAITGCESWNLQHAIYEAERSTRRRNTGITVELRPDTVDDETCILMLSYGTTRVEVGVQSLFNDILAFVNREHDVRDVKEAFRMLKDYGFKVTAHMMPNLPGSSLQRDYDSFKMLFEDERFRPDGLKIYPTLVLENTELYEMYLRKEYIPYTLEEVIELLAKVKAIVPPYIRIYRIQRDIPSGRIAAGVRKGNLRELVQWKMRELGLRCRCIRCREVGRYLLKGGRISDLKPTFRTIKYKASGGTEFFLSFEDSDKDVLLAFLRLRITSPDAPKPLRDAAIVRELHVYGPLVPVGREAFPYGVQHRGLGRKLMEKAEEIALEHGISKIYVISGIGVREYYRKLGYKRWKYYMLKTLVQ